MSTATLVSIGMPVFNGEAFLGEALDSLLAQDHENVELIISDNASTDRTSEICMDVAARDMRVRYHRNEENVGPIRNFNGLLHAASAEYFMWAAADDLWESTYVSALLAKLEEDPRAALSFSAFDNIDERGEHVRDYPRLFELPSDRRIRRLLNYLEQPEHLGKANLIYGLTRRRALLSAISTKGWRRAVWGSDMLVVFHVLALGDLLLSDELLFHKRLLATFPEQRHDEGSLPRRRPSPTRVTAVRAALWTRNAYHAGYASIIGSIGLPAEERARLLAALAIKAGAFNAGEIRDRLIEPDLRRLLSRGRRATGRFR
jgi:hypothetical protein